MERVSRILSIVAALLVLAACGQHALLDKFATPDEQRTAKTFIDQLRHHDFERIEKAADASISGASLSTLDHMAALMPSDPPISVTLVGAHRFSSSAAGTTLDLTFEYHFTQSYIVASLATKMQNGQLSIVGFHIYPETQSLESQNRFTWSGKSALQYAVLGYGIAAALFSLAVLLVCAKTKMQRRKWLWILFILFGFGKLSVNWTTGQWGISPLALQLLSASYQAQLYGPWIISVSLPFGAILFLLRLQKRADGLHRAESSGRAR